MDLTQAIHIYMDELSCDVDGFDVSLLHINKRRFINFYNVLLVPCMRMPNTLDMFGHVRGCMSRVCIL